MAGVVRERVSSVTQGEAALLHGDGRFVTVQWGAETEVVTGRRLVLAVALHTSR